LEVFHCLPDELMDRVDACADRTGRRWQDVLAEALAYYTLKEREEVTKKNQRAMAEYLRQHPTGGGGTVPGTFGRGG
jgi:predicted transcriptional regulator